MMVYSYVRVMLLTGNNVDVFSLKRKAAHQLNEKSEKNSIQSMTVRCFKITHTQLQRKDLEGYNNQGLTVIIIRW